MVVCIIPARGGSKRIKNKNIREFAGKPLLYWTIKAAQDSGIFRRIIVSTESEEIAEIAKKYIDIPFLREDCFDDYSTNLEMAIHVLEQCNKYLNESYETTAILQPTSPLRTAIDISNIYKYYRKSGLNSAIGCFKPLFVNPWWLAELDDNNRPKKLFEDNMKRSQDYPELVCPSGAIIFVNTNFLLENKDIHKNITYFPLEWKNAIDIDTEEEFEIAEILAKYKKDNLL